MRENIKRYQILRNITTFVTVAGLLILLFLVPLEYKFRIGIPLVFISVFVSIFISRKIYNAKNTISNDELRKNIYFPNRFEKEGYDLISDTTAGYNGVSPLKDIFKQ